MFGPTPATGRSGAYSAAIRTKWERAHFALPWQSVVGILSRTGLPLLRQHEGRHRDPNRIHRGTNTSVAGCSPEPFGDPNGLNSTRLDFGICFGRRVCSEAAANVLVGAIRPLRDLNCQVSDRANTECVHMTKD